MIKYLFNTVAWAILLASANAAMGDEGLQPDEVLVIANRASAPSMAVAADYMQRRHIPESNLFVIDYKQYQTRQPLDDNPLWMPHPVFRETVVQPLKKFLEQTKLKDKILCLVTVYDTPYRVGGFDFTESQKAALIRSLGKDPASAYNTLSKEKQQALIDATQVGLRDANASFDSELALLYCQKLDAAGLDDYQRMRLYLSTELNPFLGSTQRFRQFRQGQIKAGADRLYMVARLDGPSPEIAGGLVQKAMQAEAQGVSGAGFFDARGGETGRKKPAGMDQGDWWVRRAAIETGNAGFSTIFAKGGSFKKGDCPNALFYWGWYQSFAYNSAAFNGQFPVGAIGCHIASYEAAHLNTIGRTYGNGQKGPWCPGMLTDGITATMGPVAEPYLHAFPHTEVLFPRLFQGWTLGEAYWAAVPHASWMMVLIGDPLYAPFAGKNQLKTYVTGTILLGKEGTPPAGLPAVGKTVDVSIVLQAANTLFKAPSTYRVLDPGNNDPSLEIAGMNSAKFQVQAQGKTLRISGLQLTRRNADPLTNVELEIHVDLAADGGEKTFSMTLP